jgi:hypothetical protein
MGREERRRGRGEQGAEEQFVHNAVEWTRSVTRSSAAMTVCGPSPPGSGRAMHGSSISNTCPRPRRPPRSRPPPAVAAKVARRGRHHHHHLSFSNDDDEDGFDECRSVGCLD